MAFILLSFADAVGVKLHLLTEKTDYIYEPWSHVCGCAIPSSCAPVPPSHSLCSFAVMSTNPEIYVPAGKHGLLFIVPL